MPDTDHSLVPPGTATAPRRNLEPFARGVSVLSGSIFGAFAARRRGVTGIVMGVLGSILLARGVSGMSPAKRLLGQKPDEDVVAKVEDWSGAALLSRAVTINAPRSEVYRRFRDLARWPDWAVNVEAIDIGVDGGLHLRTRGPTGDSEWDGQITEEEDGALLVISSDADSDMPITLRCAFRDAPAGRGTEIHGVIAYEPPGGSLGRYAAKLTQREPGIQLRRDLKRFKSLIETGEIAVNGPQGTEPRA